MTTPIFYYDCKKKQAKIIVFVNTVKEKRAVTPSEMGTGWLIIL